MIRTFHWATVEEVVTRAQPWSFGDPLRIKEWARVFIDAHMAAPGGLSIEVGTWKGGTALVFAELLELLYHARGRPMLFTIDPYGDKPYDGGDPLPEMFDELRCVVSQQRCRDRFANAGAAAIPCAQSSDVEGFDPSRAATWVGWCAPCRVYRWRKEHAMPPLFGNADYVTMKGLLAPYPHHVHYLAPSSTVLSALGRTQYWWQGQMRQFDNLTFVLLDAEHSAAAIENDLELLTPHLRAGGIVVVDNTNNDPATVPALIEYAARAARPLSFVQSSALADQQWAVIGSARPQPTAASTTA